MNASRGALQRDQAHQRNDEADHAHCENHVANPAAETDLFQEARRLDHKAQQVAAAGIDGHHGIATRFVEEVSCGADIATRWLAWQLAQAAIIRVVRQEASVRNGVENAHTDDGAQCGHARNIFDLGLEPDDLARFDHFLEKERLQFTQVIDRR